MQRRIQQQLDNSGDIVSDKKNSFLVDTPTPFCALHRYPWHQNSPKALHKQGLWAQKSLTYESFEGEG